MTRATRGYKEIEEQRLDVNGHETDDQTRAPEVHNWFIIAAWSAMGILLTACATTALVLAGRSRGYALPASPPLQTRATGFDAATLLKPGYHITPEYRPAGSWMNDPNGPFQLHGLTHVFYQVNPYGSVWASPYWGHVVSRNLAHWRRLPLALLPDQPFDRDGVFSGSTTIVDGVPTILYTGVLNYSQYGFYYQVQAMAIPAPVALGQELDPYYVSWVKPLDLNPISILPPPGASHAQFRDPVTAWRTEYGLENSPLPPGGLSPLPPPDGDGGGSNRSEHGGLWFTTVGTLQNCIGTAALYSSPDMKSWTYFGTLFSQLAQNTTPEVQCKQSMVDNGMGGMTCDAFGTDCHMWECPDFWRPAPGVLAIKYSDQILGRQAFGSDWYILGQGSLVYDDAPEQDGQDAFKGRVSGGSGEFEQRLIDYGVAYASKTFLLEDGRRLWIAWVYEDSLGCLGMCGDGTEFIIKELGWQGLQSLPRVVTYDPASQTLVFAPLPELQQLRLGPLYQETVYFPPTNNDTELHSSVGQHGSTELYGLPPAELAQWELAMGLPKPPIGDDCRVNDSMLIQEWVTAEGIELVYRVAVPEQTIVNISTAYAGLAPKNSCLLELPEKIKPSAASSLPPLCAGGHRRQLEIEGSWSVQLPLGNVTAQTERVSFMAGYEIMTGNDTVTTIFINGTVRRTSATDYDPTVTSLELWVDKTLAGGMTRACIQGGVVDLPPSGIPATSLGLQVYIDRSIVEVFALEGHARVTARIYPLVHSSAWGVRTFGGVGVNGGLLSQASLKAEVAVYDLDSCWRDEI